MSTIVLPMSILDKLDKVSRAFIWGSTTERKKQHLISWDRVCVPNVEGGLGIRKSKEMNKALIGKVGWRLLHNKESLWAQVLRKKYNVGEIDEHSWLIPKSGWSSTWRSVALGLREVIVPGVRWVIGDGSRVNFWGDKWLMNRPLLEMVSANLPVGEVLVNVRDLWRVGTGWELSRITPYLPESIHLRLPAVVIDHVTGARDRIAWNGSADGDFSVKSAYSFLARESSPRTDMSKLFTRIWRAVAPERVRVFLWLVIHQAIMTNAERFRRHFGDSSLCQVCKSGDETILHVLRDCPAMSGIWTRLVSPRKVQAFFAMSLLEWVYGNLGDEHEIAGSTWATMFAMAVWWGWKWRCGNVFGTTGKCRDRIRFIKDVAKEVTMAQVLVGNHGSGSRREERLISWTPPREGWFKLNTDGASRGNPGLATAGGVLRDVNGDWCEGFALNIGICSTPLAELWGVYYGLCIAWDRGITRLELEVDSEMIVGFLQTGISDTHPLSFLVRLCHGFFTRDWVVRIVHVYREANRLADGLANFAFSYPVGFLSLASCPSDLELILFEDVVGAERPRRVRM